MTSDDQIKWEKINQAIEEHYGLWWTDEMKEAIRRDAGEDGLAKIKEISSFANDPDLWIYAASHDAAYQKVQVLLKETYSFLSASALSRIATAAAYGWK